MRRNAFERVAGIPSATKDPKLKRLLIRLRIRENAESEKAATDLFEDDDYLAYDQELTSLVQRIAVTADDKSAWKALVYMRYNPDSETGNWLAQHRQTLPYVLQQVKSLSFVRRMNAAYMLALMLSKSKVEKSLTSGQYRSLKNIICTLALRDIAPVEQLSIKGLGLIGDVEDVPLLERLSVDAKDPYTRNFALEAASKIRKASTPPVRSPKFSLK